MGVTVTTLPLTVRVALTAMPPFVRLTLPDVTVAGLMFSLNVTAKVDSIEMLFEPLEGVALEMLSVGVPTTGIDTLPVFPSDVAVIWAFPALVAVISPDWLTVATDVADDDHCT